MEPLNKQPLQTGQDEIDETSGVSREEAALLEKSSVSQAGPDDEAWDRSTLDNTDEDGEELNEENEFSGKDLDVPGAEDDDEAEETGGEDEENNSYSLGGDKD
ncbi:MAG: hypothetical protein ABIT05_04570 [Chitinophagaceae bacterium]